MGFANAFEDFKWRGLIFDVTAGLPEVLAKEKVTAYIGFDPSADSLQVGNLLALMGLARLQRYGHTPLALAGGGTGMIGDPGGKKAERKMLKIEEVEANVEAIKPQLARFLDFEVTANPAQIPNNAEWLRTITMMSFLRDVGKLVTVNTMLARDSVKSRIGRESGISYAEFSYQLLQAYDFVQLYDRYGCTLQAGGSDQWGNIIAGVDLVRRMRDGASVHGLVYPLVTDAEGNKLGKSEKGAIYLDAEKTSPYRYYQFWLNQGDDQVIDLLKYFTWLGPDEVGDLAQKTAEQPERREAQRTLAEEMTRVTHGESALDKALQASRVLFGGDMAGLGAGDIGEVFADVPSSELPLSRLEGEGVPVVDLLAEIGITRSKGEARRLVRNGGVYVNNVKVAGEAQAVTTAQTVEGKFAVLRRGKKTYHLVRLIG